MQGAGEEVFNTQLFWRRKTSVLHEQMSDELCASALQALCTMPPPRCVRPVFRPDFAHSRLQRKEGPFSLSTSAAAPLEMWLKTINRSRCCYDDLQGRTCYFPSAATSPPCSGSPRD